MTKVDDNNMGHFEVWYADKPKGKVCLGGNKAEGIGSNCERENRSTLQSLSDAYDVAFTDLLVCRYCGCTTEVAAEMQMQRQNHE